MTPLKQFHEDGTPPDGAQVFVFGSNLAGRHGLGAAKYARDALSTPCGPNHAVGWLGQNEISANERACYGIATKDELIKTLGIESIEDQIRIFLQIAKGTPNRQFFVTRIGCGLAGYADHEIAPFFFRAPSNCSFPAPWKSHIRQDSSSLHSKFAFEERIHFKAMNANLPISQSDWGVCDPTRSYGGIVPPEILLASAYLFAIEHIADPGAQEQFTSQVHDSMNHSFGDGTNEPRNVGKLFLASRQTSPCLTTPAKTQIYPRYGG